MNLIIIFLCVCILGELIFAQYEGSSCSDGNGMQGICRYLVNCPPAISLLTKGIHPSICRFDGTKAIVCCIDSSNFSRPSILNKKSPSENRDSSSGDISRRKCKEYARNRFDSSKHVFNRASSTIECPFEKVTLITGGTKADKDEFPHMVQLGYNRNDDVEWLCAGSIISPNFILTVAHCFNIYLGNPKYIRTGITNLSDTQNIQTRRIIKLIRHPRYTKRYHDIGLLKLDRDLFLNAHARPACLYTETEMPVKYAIASGWGNTESSGEGSQDLLKVLLDRVTVESCNQKYKRQIDMADSNIKLGILDNYMLCYGSSNKDTCQGDSGGPLQIYNFDENETENSCMYWIVGLTSFGKSCGKGFPGVYTRVSYYVSWIEQNVWSEKNTV